MGVIECRCSPKARADTLNVAGLRMTVVTGTIVKENGYSLGCKISVFSCHRTAEHVERTENAEMHFRSYTGTDLE